MVMTPKIATCCYCGTRAALRMDQERHELTCSNCGAPLRNLRNIHLESSERPSKKSKGKKQKKKNSELHYVERKPPVRKPRKRRRGLMSKMLEEAFDVIEDILD